MPALATMTAERGTEESFASPARTGTRTLGTNVVWTVAGNVWWGFCQWFLLVVLAKLSRSMNLRLESASIIAEAIEILTGFSAA